MRSATRTLPTGRIAALDLDAPAPTDWRARLHQAWLAPIPGVLREHAWFIALSLFYITSGYAVAIAYGQEVTVTLYGDIHIDLYVNFASAFVILRIIWVLAKYRPDSPLRFLWNDLRETFLSPRRVLNALPVFFLLPLALSVMTSLKRLIPVIVPFSWDPAFAEIDRILHGGFHPWELLQPLLGYPPVTVAVSYAYTMPWLAMVMFLQFWFTFSFDRERMRFLLTYLLCWLILGNVAATALSSVGPCYYQYFFDGPDPFAPLMAYLNGVADGYRLPSILGQEYLWASYQEDFLRLGSGISAMPSMHIVNGFLLVLVCWRRHWCLRWGSILFLAVLQIGSVHLAWHYAIDGYVGMIVTGLFWWLVGRALAWRDLRRSPAPATG